MSVKRVFTGPSEKISHPGRRLLTTILSVILGVIAGYFRGWSDTAIRSVLDILWSFPVVILGVALGVALALGGIKIGPITIAGDSLAVPIFIIGLVYIPYMARPVRGQVLSLREKEFVEAARAQGAGPLRIFWSVVLPLCQPALGVVGILGFSMIWDQYVLPLLVAQDASHYTLPLALRTLRTDDQAGLGVLLAAAALALLPSVIVFLSFQRQFMKGLTSGAVKG